MKIKTYTSDEKQYIIDNVKTQSIKQLAANLKSSTLNIRKAVTALGFDYVIKARMLASRIQKGAVPPNKGKKVEEYMNPEQIARFKSNQYKPGNMPHNTLADGTEVLRTDKTGKVYTLVKVPGIRSLVLKHRLVWETFHKKKVPYKHKITFKDGNTSNFAIENLECISYQDQMKQNSIHQYPKEIKELMQLKGAIKRQVNKKRTHQNG